MDYYYYYGSSDAALAFVAAFGLFGAALGLVYYVIYAFFLMKLFEKANVPAWKAWVPFVNTWKLFELGGFQGALSLLFLAAVIPCVGWIAAIAAAVLGYIAAYNIGLKNGKEGVWVVLYIFLPVVWAGILGLGKSTWNDSLGKPALGPERPPTCAPNNQNYYYPPQQPPRY
ncbi:MAG TPA: hypothetical protein DEB24_00945 [Coriobacteriia bacterium]|nr:hypothetical protein [Coriobacteriia bacterium]